LGILKAPKMRKYCFKELLVDKGKAEVFEVLFELIFGNCILSRCAVELLDCQNGLLHFFPNILLVPASILNIGMVSKVQALF
jgi:hypothetical protein